MAGRSRVSSVTRSTASQPTSTPRDRKSTRLNSSHANISYAVFCLKKKKITHAQQQIYKLHHDDRFYDPHRKSNPATLVEISQQQSIYTPSYTILLIEFLLKCATIH